MSDDQADWPLDITLTDGGRRLSVSFENGAAFKLAAEYLRVMSPSAEVQGHSRHDVKVLGGKRSVAIIGIEPVGTYAVRLVFDDMHSTGLYTWGYLAELGRDHDTRWAGYLADLDANGLSRDRSGEAQPHRHDAHPHRH